MQKGDTLLIAATSLKDVFYFAEKSAGADAAYRAVELVLDIADPAQVDGMVCRNALELERPDYEDGIVAACLVAEAADIVITRDEQAFTSGTAMKYTPREFLAVNGYDPAAL